MPQMSPYNWIIMMFMLNMLFIYSNSQIYFIKSLSPKKINNLIKNKFLFKIKW